MTPLALIFMGLSWICVLGLTVWAFRRIVHADARKRETASALGTRSDPGASSE